MLKHLERVLKASTAFILRLLFRSGKPPAIQQSEIRSILVIRQHNQLGDMLCAVPLLRALREAFPRAFIALMTSPVNNEVMLNSRYVNEVMNFDKTVFTGIGILKFIGFVRGLRRKRFDLAVVPATVSTSFTSDLLAFLSGAQIRIGASSLDGNENPSGFFFNVPVELDWRTTPHRHQGLRNADILKPLSLKVEDLKSEIALKNNEVDDAKLFADKAKNGKSTSIAFHPGAGKVPNRWPAERFAALAGVLSKEFDTAIVITSGPMDVEPVRDMTSQLTVPYQLVEGQPVRVVASSLAAVDLLISNDTGIMHVGAAVGTPVLSLFGPTDPEQWAPSDGRSRYIRGKDERIDSIPVDEVLRVAREMLRAKAKSV